MKNAFTEKYVEELQKRLTEFEAAMARGASSWEEYNKLVGKHNGVASALAYFNDLLDALNKQE